MPEIGFSQEGATLSYDARSRGFYVTWSGCTLGCLVICIIVIATGLLGYASRRDWLPAMGAALNVSPEIQHSDVIVVLGGGDGDRERYAGALYKQGLASHVIATGGPDGTTSAADALTRWGIPYRAVTLANGTQNTYQDALSTRHLMEANHWQTALLVTDPYHMRRSIWTFRSVLEGTTLEVQPAPVVGGWFQADRWWTTEEGFAVVNEEYLKIAYYVIKGQIRFAAITGR
ncbi:MAG TPA: YdcF family protein [Chloroflexota bacterium]|nr:YdcF family protein [Chloroflexota bacterium]